MNTNGEAIPFLCVLIDGDGHHEIPDEADLHARIIDLVMSNDEITFKKSVHGTLPGFPRVLVIEVE
jgi:hypothetical protein